MTKDNSISLSSQLMDKMDFMDSDLHDNLLGKESHYDALTLYQTTKFGLVKIKTRGP